MSVPHRTDDTVSDEWRVLRTVVWRRLDEPSMEYCRLAQSERGFLLSGQVVTALRQVPRRVHYDVLLDRAWQTVQADVEVVAASDVARLTLRRGADGRWLRDGTELSELRGLYDVDLGFTPATNTLPIRRLAPDVGAAHDVTAVWVRFPDLAVETLSQKYTRVDELTYQYESNGGRFRAVIAVDDLGLVTSYERLFERIAAG